MNQMERIIDIIRTLSPNPKNVIEGGTLLLEEGILDSFDMVNLVYELNEAFAVEIGPLELLPENFESPEKIDSLIQKMRGDSK